MNQPTATPPRASPRHRRRLMVSLGNRLPAFTADVSSGGFCAEMPAVFLPGSQVHGTLSLGDHEIPFKGEVTWAKAGDPRTSTRSRFGVRFTDISRDFSEFFARPQVRHLVRWFT